MILRMFYREDPVMDISVIDSPGEFIVQSWNILCPDLLPEELKPAFAYTEYKGLQQNTLDQWINQRAIPDYRENIDDCLLSLYHLPYHLFGRMYRYQHTAALLSHFASGFDDYVLSLTKTEIICYAPIDPRLINLYRLRPIEKDEWYMRKQNPVCAADECLKKRIDIPIPYENQCIPSISYTIPSSVPSWLERGTKGLVLKQKLSEWNQGELRNRAEFLIEYGEKHAFAGKRCLSDNQFCTDFSDISECDETLRRLLGAIKNADSRIRTSSHTANQQTDENRQRKKYFHQSGRNRDCLPETQKRCFSNRYFVKSRHLRVSFFCCEGRSAPIITTRNKKGIMRKTSCLKYDSGETAKRREISTLWRIAPLRIIQSQLHVNDHRLIL